MKILFEGKNFDLDKLDFDKSQAELDDWHTPEGLFLRKLKHRTDLIDQMVSWAERNLELLEILDPPDGPPGLATQYFENELKRCRSMPGFGMEYFVHFLLIRHPKAFMPGLRQVLESTHGPGT